MGKVIAIGKLGRSIKFGRHLWKDVAGNNEPATLFSAIANKHPENTYVLIGKSDFSICNKEYIDYWFKHGNVIDAWEGFNSKEDDPITYPYERVKNMKFDYAIINGGISGGINTPGVFKKYSKKTGEFLDEIANPLIMFKNYAGPLIYFLNKTKVKWVNFTADARQLPIKAYDLFNGQVADLATIEEDFDIEHFADYGNQTMKTRNEKAIYGMPEFLCLLDPEYDGKNWFNNKIEKDIKVGLFFHKYKDKKRFNAIKEYVNQFNEDEIQVFGEWKEEIESKDHRFKGSHTFDEIQEILPRVKYTICYPIVEGDISAKWVEAMRAGIIPFFDKTYDKKRILQREFGIPDFCYVESAEDFKNKITILENDEEKYIRLRNVFENTLNNVLKMDLSKVYVEKIEKLIYND